MDLSIIVPTYNASNHVVQLLKSIEKDFEFIKKRGKQIEIIIVDDRSDDYFQLREIISKFSLDIKLLKNEMNLKGAGVCRNIGLREAEGDMILFADADDYFIDKWFEQIEPYFSRNEDIVFFSPTSCDSNFEVDLRAEKFQDLLKNYLNDRNLENELSLKTKFHMVWSKLFRRSFLEKNKIQFDETIVANDVMFSLKSSLICSSFEVVEKSIYCWYFNNKSLTTKVSEENFLIRCQVMRDRAIFIRKSVNKKNWKCCDLAYGNLILEAFFRYKFDASFCFKIFRMFLFDKNMNFLNKEYFSLKKIRKFTKKNSYY